MPTGFLTEIRSFQKWRSNFAGENKMDSVRLAPFLLDISKSLIGAFFGAAAAFGANQILQHQRRRREDRAAGNLAIFILSTHINTVHLLQRELAPYRANALQMPPLEHVLTPPTVIDLKTLSFLIEAGEGQLLGEIRVAEDTFIAAVDALQKRNKFHIDEIQPAFEQAGFMIGRPVLVQAAFDALGQRRLGLLTSSSEHVLNLIDSASEKLLAAGGKLHAAIRKEFPRAKTVIQFSPAD